MSETAKELLERGYRARRERRLADAKITFEDAAEQCRRAGDRALLARAIVGMGQIERDLKNSDAALERYEDAVQIYRALREPLALAHAIRHVGDIRRDRRELELAAPCYLEALEIYRGNEATSRLDLANAMRGYALVKGETGDWEEARQLWQEAGMLYAAAGVQAGIDECERQVRSLAG